MDKILKIEEQRKKLVYAGKMGFVHWLVVIFSVVLTLAAWQYSKQQLEQKLDAKFDRNAQQVVRLVKERMQLYENVLWGAVAYIDVAGSDINYSQWLTYSNSLNIDLTYPGINGIGVIYNIKEAELANYLKQQQALRPNYSIHPDHAENDYWPITYIEPAKTNLQAVGLDMTFEKNRHSSIKKARDSGKSQLTGPITLVQDDMKTPGFLFYAPFYKNGRKPNDIAQRRDAIVGVTYAPFIMKKLMLGTLARENRNVSIQIKDGEQLLFDDDDMNMNIQLDDNPLYSKEISIDMYGRIWTFYIQSDMSFREEASSNQSLFIIVGGLTIDFLLLCVFMFLSKANRKALRYADQMTIVLEEQKANLQRSNQDLEQFSYIASHDLKSPLSAIKQLVSWIEEDCQQVLPDESKKHLQLLTQRSDRMMRLLDDLLAYSRVNRSVFEMEPVNLALLCKDALELSGVADQFRLEVEDVVINIQRTPLDIVLRNLVSNVTKHHHKKTGIITVAYQQNRHSHIISVADDGPGIPEAFHEKALEMFQTLQPRDKVEGSGMGLSMIKRIVEHHHGSVKIESDGINGTKVIIYWLKEQ
ncbi:CHASE domain-containing protein [Gammaproteobacteria bacterium AS21]